MPPSPPDLLLAEALLLLALDDERGFDRTQGADGALAGAVLLDLAAGGWLDASADGKLVPSAVPPADRPPGVLGDALVILEADDKPRGASHWVRKLPNEMRPIKGSVARGLVERGVLSEHRHKVLGLVPTQRYPQDDPEPERALREHLRAVLTADGDVPPRTAMLVPLLRALNLVPKLVANDERKAAGRRAKAISEDPGAVGSAVRAALADTQIAVYAAVATAVAISAGSGSGDGGGG